jgi:hypothetical protein
MGNNFTREARYIVIKASDAQQFSFSDKIKLMDVEAASQAIRKARGKQPMECVVIESDWPEYEPAWQMIEQRMKG